MMEDLLIYSVILLFDAVTLYCRRKSGTVTGQYPSNYINLNILPYSVILYEKFYSLVCFKSQSISLAFIAFY